MMLVKRRIQSVSARDEQCRGGVVPSTSACIKWTVLDSLPRTSATVIFVCLYAARLLTSQYLRFAKHLGKDASVKKRACEVTATIPQPSKDVRKVIISKRLYICA